MTTPMRIDLKKDPEWKGLIEFVGKLPAHKRNQHYRFVGSTFDVAKALFILEERHPHEMDAAWVQKAHEIFGITCRECNEGRISLLRHVNDEDWAHSDGPDMEDPIIVAYVKFKDSEGANMAHLLIDGVHRLHHAFVNGLGIKAHFMSPWEAEAIATHAFDDEPLLRTMTETSGCPNCLGHTNIVRGKPIDENYGVVIHATCLECGYEQMEVYPLKEVTVMHEGAEF